MSRSTRRKNDSPGEMLLKLIPILLVGASIAIGGITHFTQVLSSLAKLFFSVVAIGLAVIAVTIVSVAIVRSALVPRMKAAIGLFIIAGATFVLFWAIQPPVVWPAVPMHVTHVNRADWGTVYVTGSVQAGLALTPITLSLPPGSDVPEGSRSIQVYEDPEHPGQISVTPKVGDGHLTHLSLLVFSGLAVLAGFGCVFSSWRDSNERAWESRGRPVTVAMTRAPSPVPVPAPWPPPPAAPTSSTAIAALRRIDWYQFETLMARLLELEGFAVTRSGGARPDGGVDLIAERGGRRIAVQCKHWKNWKVSPRTIRELVGTRQIAKADEIILATLNPGTLAARELAEDNAVTILTEDDLAERMLRAGFERFADCLDPEDKHCPVCDGRMILRHGRDGPFWGCEHFPTQGCRGTIEA